MDSLTDLTANKLQLESWGTGGRAGGRTRGRSGDEGDGRIDGQGGQVGGQGSKVNDGVDGVPDFSTIIAQQLQNLLPTIVAQVGDQGRRQGNGRNQNGDVVNDNIRGDVRNAIENNDRRGCTYKEFLACNLKEDSQKVKYTAGSFVGKDLTWWNSQIHTRGRETAIGMSWEDFKTLTREEFCLSNECKSWKLNCGTTSWSGLAMLRILIGFMSWLGMVDERSQDHQKTLCRSCTLTDVALRNGSIKKEHREERKWGRT
ncbi:hypothetical protein Tco_0959697 [Tanacetum coccineum]